MHIFYTPVVSCGEVMRAADDRALYKMKSSEAEDQKQYTRVVNFQTSNFHLKQIYFFY